MFRYKRQYCCINASRQKAIHEEGLNCYYKVLFHDIPRCAVEFSRKAIGSWSFTRWHGEQHISYLGLRYRVNEKLRSVLRTTEIQEFRQIGAVPVVTWTGKSRSQRGKISEVASGNCRLKGLHASEISAR